MMTETAEIATVLDLVALERLIVMIPRRVVKMPQLTEA